MKAEPARYSKPCGLVQLIVQDHPYETVANMRWTWTITINGAKFTEGWARSARAAKNQATKRARTVLAQALEHLR